MNEQPKQQDQLNQNGEERLNEGQEKKNKSRREQNKSDAANNVDNSTMVEISFTCKSGKPNIQAPKLTEIFRTVVQENPLQSPPRVYANKFQITFASKPTKGQMQDLTCQIRKAFPNYKIFVKLNEVTQRDKSTIYLKKLLNINNSMMETYLKDHHIEFKEVRIVCDKATNQPKNFGYIEFSSETEAREAAKKLDGAKLGKSNGIKAVMNID